MKKANLLFIFCCLLSTVDCFSQRSKIDSLLILVKNDKQDTFKLHHLNKLSQEYDFIGSYDSAMLYADLSLKLTQKILKETKDPKIRKATLKGEAATWNAFGNVNKSLGNYPEALKNYVDALNVNKTTGDKKSEAVSYNNIGGIHYAQGNYAEALKNHFAALKIRDASGDKKGLASSYNNIGNVYSHLVNYPEALKNYFASLELKKEFGDKKGMGATYNNIGVIYGEQGNYDEALKNHFASLKIREEIGDRAGIATSNNNIGNVNKDQGNYPEALKNYFVSLKIREAIGDKTGISTSCYNIGNIFTKQKRFREAEEYLVKARDLSGKIGYTDCLKETYKALSELNSAKGDFKSAYEDHKQYILYRDSLDNEETRKKTIQSQMTYDFEKKEAVAGAEHKKELENQEVLAEEKSRKQKVVLLFVVGGLFLVLVFAGFIFRSLRITRKQKNTIEEQKDLVELQKQEVEQQKTLVEEHQKEIIDSIMYARRIQRSQLPTETYIDRTLKRLMSNSRQ